ncbi:hypothetical protein BDD12DRAFT_918442 [Trichophaea hybrida]|nr:hypothetical protein BDD12DRAFT_918442 [Trichophaea hybrida]
MVTVAVISCGSVGTQIIQSLLRLPQHRVVVLSRTPQPSLTSLGAIVHPVTYTSLPELTTALTGVHTVISCLYTFSTPVTISSTLLVLQAAQAAGVSRFAPCEFSYSRAGNTTMSLYAAKETIMDAVVASGLECTAFRTGQFMNYLAHGAPREGGLAGCRDFAFIVDLEKGVAEIPGMGEERVTMVTTQDVGRFVAEACGLERWETEMGMGAETTCYNEVVREAERVTGRKVEVMYRSRDELERMVEEEGDEGRRFYLQAMLSVAKGEAEVEMRLNELVDVKTTGVREFLEMWWGEEKGELVE